MRIPAFAIAAALAVAPAALAQEQRPQLQCGPLAAMVSALHQQFGETIVSAGVASNGVLTQTYANEKTGTWTVLATIPGGPTCAVSAGDGFVRDPARTWAAWLSGVLGWMWGSS